MEINNRELALLVWSVVLVVLVVIYPRTRKNIGGLLKVAFDPRLSVIYGIMAVYTAAIVYFLDRLELWDSSQLNNTVLWFLTVALVSLKDIVKSEQINYFKKTAIDIFGLTALIQFITGVYTFSFIVELLLVPVAALLGGMIAVAETDPKNSSVKKLLNGILVAAGVFTIGFTIYKTVTDFKTFASKGTLSDFLIPGVLSLMFLPLVYVLSIYAAQETAFIGFSRNLKPKLLRFAKWHTLVHFAFNKEDLFRWKRFVLFRKIETKNELRSSVKFIKDLKKIEKNPPNISPEAGWSPYKAKDLLIQEGIITTHYQPTFEDDWSASSNYFKIDDNVLANTIAYYIQGNSDAAKTLKLVLDVNDPTKADRAHTKMLDCAEVLYRFAMKEEIPKRLSDALIKGRNKELRVGKIYISVYRNPWHEHRLKGYNLNLIVSLTDK